MKHFWLTTLGILFIGCGDPKLNYKCTCNQIARGAGDNGEDVDLSFTENICDTYENIEAAFAQGGEIYQGLQTCETRMQEILQRIKIAQRLNPLTPVKILQPPKKVAQENAITCECDCIYQSEC